MAGLIPGQGVSDTDGRRIRSDSSGFSIAVGGTAGFSPMGVEYSVIDGDVGRTHAIMLRAEFTFAIKGHDRMLEPYWALQLGGLLVDNDVGSNSWGVVLFGGRLGALVRPFAKRQASGARPQVFAEIGALPVLGSDGDGLGGLIDWRATVGVRIGRSMNVYPFPPR